MKKGYRCKGRDPQTGRILKGYRLDRKTGRVFKISGTAAASAPGRSRAKRRRRASSTPPPARGVAAAVRAGLSGQPPAAMAPPKQVTPSFLRAKQMIADYRRRQSFKRPFPTVQSSLKLPGGTGGKQLGLFDS